MSSKVRLAVAGIVILLLGAGVFLAPYLTVRNMKAAAEARDSATLSGYIDFPAVRESVKATASAKLASATSAAREPSPTSSLGSALAGVFIDRMVDALVTPESIALMMTGQPPETADEQSASSTDTELDTSMGYETLNRFIVSVKKKDSTNAPISFVLDRDRLVFWKLSAVRLP